MKFLRIILKWRECSLTAWTIYAENLARVPSSSLFPCPWVRISGPCHWPVKLRFDAWGILMRTGVLLCLLTIQIGLHCLGSKGRSHFETVWIPYAGHHNLLLIKNCSWLLTIHQARILRKKALEKMLLDFKWVITMRVGP